MLCLPLLLMAATAFCGISTNELAKATAQLARLRDQSRWTEGLPAAKKVAELTAAVYGHDSTNTAEALQIWGWMADNNGDIHTAEKIWREALAIDEKLFGTNTVHITRRLHMLGGVYRDRGDYERGEPLLLRALELREKFYGPEHGETAQVVNSLGRLKGQAGDFAAAMSYLSRAFQIFEKRGKHSREQLAATASALSWVHLSIGDYEQAERYIRRSLEVRKELHGWEHNSVVGSLREIAALHRAEKQFDKAEVALREALRIRDKLLGTNHITRCDLLGDLGSTLMLASDLDGAQRMFEQARMILERAPGVERRLAAMLMNLGAVHENRGAYSHAKALANRALDIRVKHLGASHQFTISALQVVARMEAMLGNTAWALAQADRIQDNEETLLGNVLSFTSERQRLDCTRYSQFLRQRYTLWATINAAEPLARAILRTKGLVLDSLLEDRRMATASTDSEVQELLDRIGEQRRRMANDGASADEVEALEARLARRVMGAGRTRRSLSVQVEQVRSALPSGTVLLEWLRYDQYSGHGRSEENYGVLILSGHEKPRWIRIGPAQDVERAVKLSQHALRSPAANQAIVDSLQELYRLLWAPIATNLPANTRHVVISPDGELNFVSFATLISPDRKLLGEQYLFSYVACGRDLLAAPESAAGGTLSVWANPDFGCSADGATSSYKFSALPWAEAEGRQLCKRATEFGFTDAVLRIGDRATERELFRICSPRALHLATHGFVLSQKADRAEDDSGNEFGFQQTSLPASNPMLQSGVALAGAQRTFHLRGQGKHVPSQDDGIVTAAEIGALNLRGTWLVALAACDTGLGQARAGEGVLGLRRGFIQAGAQNLLLTLWPIDDEWSGKFTLEFYGELQKTPAPARALGQVQQAWLKKLRSQRGLAEACRIAGPYILNFQGPIR
jgi:CHAT domain-containing protein/tetratricopeptide (TPR) repeat protein